MNTYRSCIRGQGIYVAKALTSKWAGAQCLRSPFKPLSTAPGLSGQSLDLGDIRVMRWMPQSLEDCSDSCHEVFEKQELV